MRNQSSDVVQLQDHNTFQQILFYCLNLCWNVPFLIFFVCCIGCDSNKYCRDVTHYW